MGTPSYIWNHNLNVVLVAVVFFHYYSLHCMLSLTHSPSPRMYVCCHFICLPYHIDIVVIFDFILFDRFVPKLNNFDYSLVYEYDLLERATINDDKQYTIYVILYNIGEYVHAIQKQIDNVNV